jgi:ubiquinol-cytochrome c reductase cytochrome b subunit/cytochrome b6
VSGTGVQRWLAERVPIPIEWLRKPLREELPVHLRAWMGWLGGTPLILFGIQVVTGILLTFYYTPEPQHAFESVRRITLGLRFGWLVRSLHQNAGQLMIVTLFLHMIRVFVTRAYRRPRELTWVFGATLFLLTLGFGFTGYSLVYDSLSYWATTVGTNLLGDVPLIGHSLLWVLRGGPDVNPNTLSRFYNFHIGVLPTLMALALLAHIVLVRLHGVAPLEGDTRRGTYDFFPEHVLREAAIALVLLLGLVVYATARPPGLGVPADPSFTPPHIRPEWYFFPSYRWLKLVPIQVGIWTSAGFVAAMVGWPWIDAVLERVAPGRRLGVWLGAAGFIFTLTLLVWEALS